MLASLFNEEAAYRELDEENADALVLYASNEPAKRPAQSVEIIVTEKANLMPLSKEPTAEDIIKSMLTDTSYMGTEWVNQTDDLYLTIRLKDVEEGIQETLATEKRSGEVVSNLSGQVMRSPLSSLPKGVYVVRKGDVVRKVMVR